MAKKAIPTVAWTVTQAMDWAEFPEELHRFNGTDGPVWVGHGTPSGEFVWTDESGVSRTLDPEQSDRGLLVCCYPKRVAARYPEVRVALPGHDGPVVVSYLPTASGGELVVDGGT